MTLCCQCSGVTPPPPPDPGACCSKVEGEIYTRCDDNVEYSDCMLKEMGIHHPNKTCAQLRVENNYPTERTDWPEPACDLLGSCCFYFSPPFGDINRACQNAVPSGTCEKDAVINGRQNHSFHFNSYLASTCPDGGAKDQDSSCCAGDGCNNCNCKLCTSGPQNGKDECLALNNRGPVTIVKYSLGGVNDGLPIFTSGVPCSCNDVEPCCPGGLWTCFIAGSQVLMSDGSYKTIENVEIGDEVKSLDSNNTVLDLERTVLGGRKLVSINDSKFFVSYDHPIYTQDGFKSVNSELSEELYPHIEFNGDLSIGDTILSPAGEVEINSIEVREDDPNTKLYDLGLDGNHVYFVEGIAVHNCICPGITCCHESGDYCFSSTTCEYSGLYTCSEIVAIKHPTWPSTGWYDIDGNCNLCTTTTTTTTTEGPRGACCFYSGPCVDDPEDVDCADNQTKLKCDALSVDATPAGNYCVVS